MELLPGLDGGRMSWDEDGPMNPWCSLCMGSWWLTRENEFSGAHLRSMSFNAVQRTVSLCLPASKFDPHALGETVTHGCCCPPGGPWSLLCPYQLAVDHFRFLMASKPDWFNEMAEPVAGAPPFP